MKPNLVLIGMPSSGKSTKGKVIAKRLGMKFLDTDELITHVTGRTPAEIVRESGREEFISVQDRIVASQKTEGTVIATGGGIIYSRNALETLKVNGTVVFLNVPENVIVGRLNKKRLLSGQKGTTASELFRQRQPLYKAAADIEIDCAGKESDEIVADILSKVSSMKGNI